MFSDSIYDQDRVNLENCATEPIHIIGATQAYGVLLACDPVTLIISQAGENTSGFFGKPAGEFLGKSLSFLIGEDQVGDLKTFLKDKNPAPLQVKVNNKNFLVLSHISDGNLILDFEPLLTVQDPLFFHSHLSAVLDKFQEAKNIAELCENAVVITKKIFKYHRVMIYKFDEQWNGEVIAEDREKDMEPWLGLHYPATDIPAQSRELFLKHRLRVITDVNYSPVPIVPEISPLTGQPLDISGSGLRAVSPIHIEYLQNMGVGASLSAAIVVKGKLWGLIACHHKTEKYLDFYQRESCRFLAHMFSNQLELIETSGQVSRFELAENIRRQLVVQMKYQKDLFGALNGDTVKFTDLISCGGGAIYIRGKWELSGNTPAPAELENLLNNFIRQQSKRIFLTQNLSSEFPEAGTYRATASGLLSLRIAENKYIFWFKPEVLKEVNWGGNPQNKAFYNKKEQRLSPRKSFEKWSEKLTGTSDAWDEQDKNIARSFREDITHILLAQQREEIEALNFKLLEANKELELFSYGLSHDLRAPIRGMEGFLTILEEDHGQDLSDEGREMLHMTRDLTERMNNLIDDILEYSRLSHTAGLDFTEVDTSELIKEVLELFNVNKSYPDTEIKVQPQMLKMFGDRRMLFQVWANLLNNALKYSAKEELPKVEVGFTDKDGREVFFVKDNGIGIDTAYKEKIFETFQRAVGSRFKGTGIGLAIVKKIVEKHNGKVWVESISGQGSQFYFYIDPPKKKQEELK